MIEAAVVGAAGYGGGELLRLLANHSNAHLSCAISETFAGQPLSRAFPGLTGIESTRHTCFEAFGDGSAVAKCDVVFMAQENTKAMEIVPQLLAAGCRIVDLSADFRFRDVDTYKEWYGKAHVCPSVNAEAVYGLPELHREAIRKTHIVGNPGCHATAGILGLAPLVQHGWIDTKSLIIDSKTGVSGGGRSKFVLEYHFPEINESVSAYKIGGTHRHTPEIEMALGGLGQESVPFHITFTPHLIPMTRGILATCYGTLLQPISTEEVVNLYHTFYADAPFVLLVQDPLPATKHTLGTNYCHIGLRVDARNNRVTIISCIDNLVKGAAGQAIQNMNLMCGFNETAGLQMGGLWP